MDLDQEDGVAAPLPGGEDNPIDVDVDAPVVYAEGAVAGAAVDLAEGEDDPTCFICQHVTHDGFYCNQRQECCGAQCHHGCIQPWFGTQMQRFGNVSCPICRRVLLT